MGCSIPAVHDFVHQGRLTPATHDVNPKLDRAAVETLASSVYGWLKHRNDPEPYWMSGERAAQTLGVDRATLRRLGDDHRLSWILDHDGTRLYRTRDLVAVHRAREARSWS